MTERLDKALSFIMRKYPGAIISTCFVYAASKPLVYFDDGIVITHTPEDEEHYERVVVLGLSSEEFIWLNNKLIEETPFFDPLTTSRWSDEYSRLEDNKYRFAKYLQRY